MGKARKKTTNLPAKLLAIRDKLGVSQSQLAILLELENGAARISEYESGRREPNLGTLLRYAKLVRVSLDVLADETQELKFPKSWKRPRRVNEFLMRDGLRRIQIKTQIHAQRFITPFAETLMGKQKRPQPELLAAKLLHIRKRLRLTQPQMLDSLKLKQDLSVGRISEYEHGIREPNLIVLLQYARAARISTDELIDDDIDVDDLRIVRSRSSVML